MAIIFGVSVIPVLVLAGGAIDYSRALNTKTQLRHLMDAALLAGTTRLNIDSVDDIKQQIRDFIDENQKNHYLEGKVTIDDIVVDPDSGKVSLAASSYVNTYFLRLAQIDQMDVSLVSEAEVGNKTFEIALVLDNSGSMEGSKIEDLRTAVDNLTQILFGEQTENPNIHMGVVPFSGLVNVGSQYADAEWMDTEGKSSVHKSTFLGSKTRFDIFNEMNNVSWRGCVETRAAPYDTDDTEPVNNDKNTYFVPSFAPDEPDGNTNYLNNYIGDNGGSCNASADVDNNSCSSASSPSCVNRQKKTCKYEGETPDTSLAYGTRKGPNFLCDSVPLTPLTNVRSTLETAYDNMQAYGGTNIHLAVAWGWRLLSPGEPFTEGVDYDTPNNSKIIILMTDGSNDTIDRPTHTKSIYSAYGFHTDNRLDAADDTDEAMEAAMDAKTLETCNNAKDAGIQIYTIAFDVDDEDTLNLMRSCATHAGMAFKSSSGSDLIETFEEIAAQISKLHLSK